MTHHFKTTPKTIEGDRPNSHISPIAEHFWREHHPEYVIAGGAFKDNEQAAIQYATYLDALAYFKEMVKADLDRMKGYAKQIEKLNKQIQSAIKAQEGWLKSNDFVDVRVKIMD